MNKKVEEVVQYDQRKSNVPLDHSCFVKALHFRH